jgi:hypothetical protein
LTTKRREAASVRRAMVFVMKSYSILIKISVSSISGKSAEVKPERNAAEGGISGAGIWEWNDISDL